jgi:hypothetical protein
VQGGRVEHEFGRRAVGAGTARTAYELTNTDTPLIRGVPKASAIPAASVRSSVSPITVDVFHPAHDADTHLRRTSHTDVTISLLPRCPRAAGPLVECSTEDR